MDQFDLSGKGTGVTCITHDDSLRLHSGNKVVIKRPSLPDLEVEILGFEVLRNDWSPQKPHNFAILLPASIGAKNVPRDSEIWAEVAPLRGGV
jgi:hypothetical protein